MSSKPTEEKSRGKSMDQFRSVFDIKLRICKGVSTILRGVYMTDQEFREACGIASNEWRRYADDSEFDACRCRLRGQIMWAQPKMMKEMREIAGIVTA